MCLYVCDSVSPDDFKILIINLRNESDPKIRASVSRKLSETLLKPHGFEAYFDYISSISDNSIESINIFSKIVFNRPSFFDDDSVIWLCGLKLFKIIYRNI